MIRTEIYLWESAGHEFAEQPSLGVDSPCHLTYFGKPLLAQATSSSRINTCFGQLDFLPAGAHFGTAEGETWLAQ